MASQEKVTQLKEQLEHFLNQLDDLDPEKTSIDDIDELIKIIEKMERELS
ncbi:SE1561 family protein [Saliterribacillus persicus]|uniref:Uncharacterized protein n=1 Tax=Saliterribacillus persicus TaxID=930114 RepID=A0A368X7M8_9BACI|nr:SE1561 family protein [Saliterribacillus persicus]RCW62988.1 hypothetical protein DFR57_12126 [Saliterribacillus persicus]